MKKRLRVVERCERELSPIETAIDEMRQRVSELQDVVLSKPTDIKKLQLRLQVTTLNLMMLSYKLTVGAAVDHTRYVQ